MRDVLSSRRRLGTVVVSWIASYAIMASVGFFFLIYKTLIVPVFLAYGLTLPHARRSEFLRAWVPFLLGTVTFDLLRGGIYQLIRMDYRPVFSTYVMSVEGALFGTPAVPLVFQRFQNGVLDGIASTLHAAHFAYFLAIGIFVWHLDRNKGAWFQRAMYALMSVGLLCYLAVPTTPPWLASQEGLLPPISHAVAAFYRSYMNPQLHAAFDTNPVAAMPSLHVAFPVVCAFITSTLFARRIALLFWLYALAVSASSIYLGEHYATDVLAGFLIAWFCVRVTRVRVPDNPRLAF